MRTNPESFCVEEKTTPRPILGMNNKFPFHRIHMHILKLLNELVLTPHIKIVETRLPERGRVFPNGTRCQNDKSDAGNRVRH
jgi:hypothetical protein